MYAETEKVCQGLLYIQQELRVCHPTLETEQILLSEKGDVKIGKSSTSLVLAFHLGCLLLLQLI
jgi:hypothetical protein